MKKSQKTVFTLSVILNVLLIGIVAGYAFSPMHHRGGGDRPRFHDFEKRIERLAIADEKKAEVVRLFKGGFERQKDERKQMKQERRKIEAILSADVFDEVTLRATFAEMQGAKQALHSDMSDVLVAVAKTLNAEERKELARMLHEIDERRGR